MLRLIIAVPLIIVLVIFAISNRQTVLLDFLGYQANVAFSGAVLVAAGFFFLLGAFAVWISELRQRRRARRAEQRVRVLEEQLAGLRASASPLPVPALPPA